MPSHVKKETQKKKGNKFTGGKRNTSADQWG